MQKLSTLEHPLLTENIMKVLAHGRIKTILDFLNEDVEKLCTITKLTLPQVLAIRNCIFERYSAPVFNGLTLLVKHNLNIYLDTGIESLNTMLNGGLPKGFITELCGLANSGKTQLCYQLAINCVKDSVNSVLYVDTKGDFSAGRIQKILDSYKKSYKEMAEIMFKIKVVRIWTMEELIELFQTIKSGTLLFNNLSLIIIDSLPCLMFQHLGDDNKVDEKETHSSTFRETNYVEKQSRCLGKYWQQIPALVLLIEKHQSQNKTGSSSPLSALNISVLRSNSKVLKQCVLKLDSYGVS